MTAWYVGQPVACSVRYDKEKQFVARLTKLHVILDNDEKYSRKYGTKVGARGFHIPRIQPWTQEDETVARDASDRRRLEGAVHRLSVHLRQHCNERTSVDPRLLDLLEQAVALVKGKS
jgi:hypothetical protein